MDGALDEQRIKVGRGQLDTTAAGAVLVWICFDIFWLFSFLGFWTFGFMGVLVFEFERFWFKPGKGYYVTFSALTLHFCLWHRQAILCLHQS